MLLAVACQSVFGDFKVGDERPDASTADAGRGGQSPVPGAGGISGTDALGGAPSQVCTRQGDFRCTEGTLEVCDSVADDTWSFVELCSSQDVCDAVDGRCLLCAPDGFRCSGWRLEQCNPTGDTWFLVEECATASYCDSGAGVCVECLLDEAFCSDQTLYVCNTRRDGWQVTECASADECIASTRQCRPCIEGELQCSEAVLERCTAAATWEVLDTCTTPGLCTATLEAARSNPEGWEQICVPPVCDLGTYRCDTNDGRRLLGCPPARDGWVELDVCLTAALCNDETGLCEDGCVPNTVQCVGAELRRCLSDGTGFETLQTCQSASECNATLQDCVACQEGDFQCNGAVLRECNSEREWTTLSTCQSAVLCDATTGTCDIPVCATAGQVRCNGAYLEECSTDLTGWTYLGLCASAELCSEADERCNLPVCQPAGLIECDGNELRQCNPGLTGWNVLLTCDADQVCDSAGEQCLEGCPTPSVRCNAGQPESCVNGLWSPLGLPCATNDLCHADTERAFCDNPVCGGGLPDYRCNPENPLQIEVCNAGRTGWDLLLTCDSGQLCDVGGQAGDGPPQCDFCPAGSFVCQQEELQQCNASGQSWASAETCEDAEHCFSSTDGTTGYCYRCDPGQSQCVGTEAIRVCAEDRRDFAPSTSCEHGCQDNPGDLDYCAACPVANAVECVQTEPPGSLRTCAANRSQWSAETTCEAGFGCVDNGTEDYCADACQAGQSECVSPTSLHTCASDGSQWGPTISECEDEGSLKSCSGGVFSGSEDCPEDLPICSEGVCICDEASPPTCEDSAVLLSCVDGAWQPETCVSPTGICSEGACVQCTAATASTDCSGELPVCLGGTCVACDPGVTPARCEGGARQICDAGSWVPAPCGTSLPVCSGAGVCVQCVGDGDCEAPNPACVDHACVQCDRLDTPYRCEEGVRQACNAEGSWEAAACMAPQDVCTGAGVCVECVDDGDCEGTTPACRSGVCVQCNPVDTPYRCEAGERQACNAEGSWEAAACTAPQDLCTGAGQCVECLGPTDCADPIPICDEGVCVECVEDGDCDDGETCSANICVV